MFIVKKRGSSFWQFLYIHATCPVLPRTWSRVNLGAQLEQAIRKLLVPSRCWSCWPALFTWLSRAAHLVAIDSKDNLGCTWRHVMLGKWVNFSTGGPTVGYRMFFWDRHNGRWWSPICWTVWPPENHQPSRLLMRIMNHCRDLLPLYIQGIGNQEKRQENKIQYIGGPHIY